MSKDNEVGDAVLRARRAFEIVSEYNVVPRRLDGRYWRHIFEMVGLIPCFCDALEEIEADVNRRSKETK